MNVGVYCAGRAESLNTFRANCTLMVHTHIRPRVSLTRRKNGQSLGTFQKECPSRNRKNWLEEYCNFEVFEMLSFLHLADVSAEHSFLIWELCVDFKRSVFLDGEKITTLFSVISNGNLAFHSITNAGLWIPKRVLNFSKFHI